MSEQPPKTFEAEMRETVLKSSLTGVAATMLAVTIFSPAGLGGVIGTSLASGFGVDPNMMSAEDNVYARLPAYPAPLSADEVSSIRGQLSASTETLQLARSASEDNIERVRAIAITDGVVTFAPVAPPAALSADLRLTTTPVEEPAPQSAGVVVPAPRDEYLELAELMFAHENL